MTPHDTALIILAVLGVLNSFLTHMNKKAIQQVHLELNGRMGELLRVTSEAKMAEGNLAGRAQQTAERAASDGGNAAQSPAHIILPK